MGDETKENSSPIDSSDNLSDEDLAAPVKRMKLDPVEDTDKCMIAPKKMDRIQSESDKHEEGNTPSTERSHPRGEDEVLTFFMLLTC